MVVVVHHLSIELLSITGYNVIISYLKLLLSYLLYFRKRKGTIFKKTFVYVVLVVLLLLKLEWNYNAYIIFVSIERSTLHYRLMQNKIVVTRKNIVLCTLRMPCGSLYEYIPNAI